MLTKLGQNFVDTFRQVEIYLAALGEHQVRQFYCDCEQDKRIPTLPANLAGSVRLAVFFQPCVILG
jgi:hypothetical protein